MDTGLVDRLEQVRGAVATAARGAGRRPEAVTLIVVTKAAGTDVFSQLARAGVTDVGENRVQQGIERVAGREGLFRWHFIGGVQSNKARRAVAAFDVFHGIDSVALMQRIDRAAGELGRHPEVLLQVNVSGEGTKQGLAPDAVPEAVAAAADLAHARLVGLMTMAPQVDDPRDARPVFAALAALRDEVSGVHGGPDLPHLSMGMTSDFEVAIEEGATFVRVGRRIVAPAPMT